jgi:hypothetical protein
VAEEPAQVVRILAGDLRQAPSEVAAKIENWRCWLGTATAALRGAGERGMWRLFATRPDVYAGRREARTYRPQPGSLAVIRQAQLGRPDEGIGAVHEGHADGVGGLAVGVVVARQRAKRRLQDRRLGRRIDLQNTVDVEFRVLVPSSPASVA